MMQIGQIKEWTHICTRRSIEGSWQYTTFSLLRMLSNWDVSKTQLLAALSTPTPVKAPREIVLEILQIKKL